MSSLPSEDLKKNVILFFRLLPFAFFDLFHFAKLDINKDIL